MPGVTLDDLMQAVTALRTETRAEVAELKAEVAALKAKLAAHEAAPAPGAAAAAAEEVSEEELVLLAAAVTSYLGKRVRIRSARRVPMPQETASAWAHHGRVFVQAASHRLQRSR